MGENEITSWKGYQAASERPSSAATPSRAKACRLQALGRKTMITDLTLTCTKPLDGLQAAMPERGAGVVRCSELLGHRCFEAFAAMSFL